MLDIIIFIFILIVGAFPFIYLCYKRIELKVGEIPFFSFAFKDAISFNKAFELTYQLWYFLFLLSSFFYIFKTSNLNIQKAFFIFLIFQFFVFLLWWVGLELFYKKNNKEIILIYFKYIMWANIFLLPFLFPLIIRDRLDYKKNKLRKKEAEKFVIADEKSKDYYGNFENVEGIIVREIMVPRIEIVGIKDDATLSDLKRVFAESRHSRIPVYSKTLDNVIGIVNLKDFITIWDEKRSDESIASLIKPVLYVPETKKISTIIKDFKENENHIAIVLNEYGGTSGLVTMHDVIEKIIGEIKDESDKEERIIEINGYYIMNGKTDIEKVEEILKMKLKDGDYVTISGFIFNLIGRVPHSGEKIRTPNMIIEILSASERRINKIRIKKLDSRRIEDGKRLN